MNESNKTQSAPGSAPGLTKAECETALRWLDVTRLYAFVEPEDEALAAKLNTPAAADAGGQKPFGYLHEASGSFIYQSAIDGPYGSMHDLSKMRPLYDRPAEKAGDLSAVTDANDICQLPPVDWYCTRKAGHDGPCAAHRNEPDRELDADDHASIAQGMARINVAMARPTAASAATLTPYGYAAEARDGHVTFFKERPTGFDQPKWNGLVKVVELYDRAPDTSAGDLWQPIITAPHDEVLLLAYEFDRPGDWRIKVGGFWNGKWEVFGASWTPTRWMPLPAAPTATDYAARRAGSLKPIELPPRGAAGRGGEPC